MVDHDRDVVQTFGDPVEDRTVLGVDEIENLSRIGQVNAARARIPGLRTEALQELEEGAVVQDRTPGSTAPPGAVIA